jgi:tungstate transport system substrate-binding protein
LAGLALPAALALLLALLLATGAAVAQEQKPVIRMATTTSTADTGLLDYLFPEFEKDTGLRVEYVATGTGKALTHGRNGDVDIVLVHSPAAEKEFVAEGFGVERIPVFWNDFVVLGPQGDPAGIKSAASAAEALRLLSERKAPFVSRGDDSGTHKCEKALWQKAGITPAGEWYIEAGQGMGACLTMANEKLAYVLTDRGTYLSMRENLELAIAFEGSPDLLNPYALIAVSPAKYPDVNQAGARKLIEWMTSPRARDLVANFKVGGESLFHLFEEQPPAGSEKPAGGPPPDGK